MTLQRLQLITICLRLAIIATVIFSASPAQSQAEQSDFPTAKIVGGQSHDLTGYPVAYIIGYDFSCSGVLVGPSTVLTAGHCIQHHAYYYTVVVGNYSYQVSQALYHRNFIQNVASTDSNDRYDLGILRLTEQVLNVQPFPVLYDYRFGLRESLVVSGFGTNEVSGITSIDPYYQGKSATLTIDAITQGLIRTRRISSTGSSCTGDSGGPLIKLFGQGFLGVAGIVTSGTTRNDYQGNCLDSISDYSYFVDLQSPSSQDFLSISDDIYWASGTNIVFYLKITSLKTELLKLKQARSIKTVQNRARRLSASIRLLGQTASRSRKPALNKLKKSLLELQKTNSITTAHKLIKAALGSNNKLVELYIY